MSWAFMEAMRRHPQQSYVQLLNNIRDVLAPKYRQRPQLSCSHPLSMSASVGIDTHVLTLADTDLLFVM